MRHKLQMVGGRNLTHQWCAYSGTTMTGSLSHTHASKMLNKSKDLYWPLVASSSTSVWIESQAANWTITGNTVCLGLVTSPYKSWLAVSCRLQTQTYCREKRKCKTFYIHWVLAYKCCLSCYIAAYIWKVNETRLIPDYFMPLSTTQSFLLHY